MVTAIGRKRRISQLARVVLLAGVGAYLAWFGSRGQHDREPLLQYVLRGDLQGLTRAVNGASPHSLDAADSLGRTALHWAVAMGRPDAVRILAESGADANAMDRANFSPMHVAVDRADLASLDALMAHGGNPNARRRLGITAFDLSLRRLPPEIRGNQRGLGYGLRPQVDPAIPGSAGHLALVRKLLEGGADPNGPFQPSGISPLNEAAESLPIDFVKLLMDFKADPLRPDASGRTVLQIAVRRDRPDLLDVLLARGVPANLKGTDGSNALHTAAELLRPEWVERLLKLNVDPNCRDSLGQTPLYVAFRTVRSRLVDEWSQSRADRQDQRLFHICRQLLDAGMDVRQGDAEGVTPLHIVVEHPACPVELIDELIKRGAAVDARNHQGESPALQARNARVLPRLLARGADPDIETRLGFSLYRRASYRGDWTQFDYLLAASKRVWTDQSFRTRRLLDLLANDRCPIDVADRLLNAGVSITLTSDGWTGHTALHLAARAGRADLAIRLLAAHADPNARDAVGKTPLHHAAERAFELGIIQSLALAGANLNATEAYGRTPLHCAIEAAADPQSYERRPGHMEAMQTLLELGADVNFGPSALAPQERRNWPFLTPLELAIAREEPEIARLLLAHGAETDREHPETGATSLHLAAMQPAEHVRMLLARGANPNFRDRLGRTPLHYAVARCSDPHSIEALIRHGADPESVDKFGNRPMDIIDGKVDRREYFNLHHRFEISQRRGDLLAPTDPRVAAAFRSSIDAMVRQVGLQ